MKRPLMILTLILLAGSASAQGTIEIRRNGKVVATNHDQSTDAVRVLFIGNSLTFWNEMPMLTRRVAASLGAKPPLVTEFSGMAGASLRQHWDREKALRAIREGTWNFVVLQPQSSEMIDRPDETAKYARLFADEIRKTGAAPVVFETWVPEDRRQTSQAALSQRYASLAQQIHATIAPVGKALDVLQRTGMTMLDPGGVHPSLRGSYLAACVFYSIFYGADPSGATYTFETKFEIPESHRRDLEREKVTAADAASIQKAARDAVAGSPVAGGRSQGPRR